MATLSMRSLQRPASPHVEGVAKQSQTMTTQHKLRELHPSPFVQNACWAQIRRRVFGVPASGAIIVSMSLLP